MGQVLTAGTLAEFRSPLGTLYVELLPGEKPVTVENFYRYVENERYENMFFHRWVPGFVIQGGGFYTANRGTSNAILDAVEAFGTIQNEFDVGRRISNTLGTLAMAKVGGDPDSASSQWFFNLADNSENLDNQNGGFTVFGEVVKGIDVLERFNITTVENGIFRAALEPPLDQLPVLDREPTFEDLVYLDIRLLEVNLSLTPQGTRVISWNSVAAEPNHIEFRAAGSDTWQTLSSVTGTGETMSVEDASSSEKARYYRVRVEF